MATFRLKYKDNKEDMYILNEDRKKGKIIEGKTLDYLISIICNEEIINGKVVNNTLYLFYKNHPPTPHPSLSDQYHKQSYDNFPFWQL